MTKNELAKIAFNAYCLSVNFHTYDGKPIPDWDQLPDEVRNAWIDSVDAVLITIGATDAVV